MGKTLDALLGRRFTTDKFETPLDDALIELRDCSMERIQRIISGTTTDVTKLLKLGHHDKAYEKVDVVIKTQNCLDVCVIIIGYVRLLLKRVYDFGHNKDTFPPDLFKAVSSLVFAVPKIGKFTYCPAAREVSQVLLSRFAEQLAARYLELRNNNCDINPQIVEKLSKEPSLRAVRMKFLKEIAAKENIVLKLEEASTSTEGTSEVSEAKLASEERVEDETRQGCGLSDPDKRGKKKQIDVPEKIVGSSSNGPQNKKSEQEGNDDDSSDGEGDVRSEAKRLMSGSRETIKLDEDTVDLLEKDVDINWTKGETGNVDHMVHSAEDTTGFKGPFSVRTRRVRKQ